MYIPRKEQSTRIEWNRLDDFATIYTNDTTMITRYDKNVDSGDWEVIGEVTDDKRAFAKMYKAPKSLLFGRRKKPKKSDAELEKLSNDMRKRNSNLCEEK